MIIREASLDDLDGLVSMGTHFLTSTYAQKLKCSPEHLKQFAIKCINKELGESAILVADNEGLIGMVGLLVTQHPFADERIAGELFWWVEPDHRGIGLSLMKAAEQWARDNKAERFQMVAPDDRVGNLYVRQGYERLETTYQRNL